MRSRGFTITELLIAISVAVIIAGVLFTITFRYYVETVKAEVTSQMALDSQSLLTQLTEDIRLADAIADTNQITDSNGPGGGWMTNDPSNIIIIESPAIDSNRDLIYDSLSGYPYSNEFVYFTDENTMYKRVLKNDDASGNIAVTTCPLAQVTESCPRDKIFSENVDNLTFQFYDINNSPTSNADQARSVSFTVEMSKEVYGETLSLANSTRITLRNQ